MHLTAEMPRAIGTHTDFNGFECLNTHDGSSQSRVEALIPLHACTEAGRNTQDMHLNATTHGVLLHLGLMNVIDDPRASFRVWAVHVTGVARGPQFGQ